MKKLFKLMMLTVAMFTLSTTSALAENAKDSLAILAKANEGDANAQMKYALLLNSAQKYAEAKEWFEASAEQGVAFSQYCLGVYNLSDVLGKRDFKTAIKWLGKAAERGYSDALKYFCNTALIENKTEFPKVRIAIFLHGTNRVLTCKNNTLVFEEGDFNETNLWTIERVEGTSLLVLKSLQGQYITGEARKSGPAGLGNYTESAYISIWSDVFQNSSVPADQPIADSDIKGAPYDGGVIDHDGRELGMENNTMYWGPEGYKLDVIFL